MSSNELPTTSLGWNLYGSGFENLGKEGRPEELAVAAPGPNELLVRVDCVSLCFSDLKVLSAGDQHPKLLGRDLRSNPTRLGHEAAVTVIAAGANLAGRYAVGSRYAVQPDVYVKGKSTAYGYVISGALTQYHLMGPEMIESAEGTYLIPIEANFSAAAAALTEPWACVDAAYTQRRRLDPLDGGRALIAVAAGFTGDVSWTHGAASPREIVISGASDTLAAQLTQRARPDCVITRLPAVETEALPEFVSERGGGFDDVISIGERDPQRLAALLGAVAFRGTFNLVGRVDGALNVAIDAGRVHYDYIAILGTESRDLGSAYGESRNRAELRTDGSMVVIGAGGPMGQMHVQRAIEMRGGPRHVVGVDVSHERLEVLRERFAPLAEANGKTLVVVESDRSAPVRSALASLGCADGADDVVVCVAAPAVIEDAATLMRPDGMLVIFAGAKIGTMTRVDIAPVASAARQYTGTSGSSLDDQIGIVERARQGQLSPGRSVAAVGGIETAAEGLVALKEGRFPGKIAIFPQLVGLPLQSVDELVVRYPSVAEAMGASKIWNLEAERALFGAMGVSR
jgi:threonine dehydrogenase-like Zn-dependent dehydrogenase